MIKELSTAIMKISKARNKYLKWLSRENYVSKDKYNSLTKKTTTTKKKRNLHHIEIT